ncbi:MAG TPA: class I SAM-dependent methyltransferase [Chthoniobacterales bacterium]|nr:class I SAM-dependent methyltransferase [Chthoniobacterales bacterium]
MYNRVNQGDCSHSRSSALNCRRLLGRHAQCAANRTRPTGFEIAELFPELVSMIHLHTPADSSVVSQLAGRDELELAFIDADHRHPLPLLDLLRLAPCVRGNGWILLHDIQLGTIGRKAAGAGETLH